MNLKNKTMISFLIFVIFGALYGLLTNIVFEKLVSEIWTPLAIALYFLVFAVLLNLLVFIIVKKSGNDSARKILIRDMAIVVVAVFISSMLFEFLYELGLNVEMTETDSYILMIDDSASMESSDPDKQRGDAIRKLVKDKPDTFNYAIYVFADDVKQARDMQPKSDGYSKIELNTEGGTAMFQCLETVITDISSGELNVTPGTRVLLLSDGYAGDTPLMKSKLLREYVKSGIVISTIGLGSGVDTKTMKQIAEYTGGVYIHIDDASMLDTAMREASVQTATRHLLGFRGFCNTDTLHAVLRTVFLLIIIALIYILKIYSYGKYYTLNMIVSGVLCVIAGFLPEITLQMFSWSDGLMRVLFCMLISATLVEFLKPRLYNSRVNIDEYEQGENDLPETSELNKEQGIDDTHVSSLR